MGNEFQFVDGTKTDRSTRRFARSHAMKGKNVGKTHQRRSRLDQVQQQTCRKSTILQRSFDRRDEKSPGRSVHGSGHGSIGSASQLVCQSLPLPLLLQTAPRSLDVIKNYFTFVVEAVYLPRLCLSLDRIKSYWIEMMFLDKTSYHCSLALMATLNGFVFASEALSLEAIHHLGKAVGLVNQKLDTAEGLSNSSISVVNFLIVRELHREENLSAEIHFKGLQKMVELRGGLSQLEEDPTLTLKICKTDIDYALHYGTSTSFYRDHMFQAAQAMGLNELIGSPDSVHSEPRFSEMSPFLQQIILDTSNVAYWFNKDDTDFKADPAMLQEVIVSVGYRLIRFHALSGPEFENKLEATYHIGLIAFMTTMFLQFDGRHFLRYSLVARCLKKVIDRGLNEEDNHNDNSMLWLLFIGGISVLAETDQSWLLLQISHLSRSLGVESWAQLHQLLVQFPWISRIHDDPGKVLWETAMTSNIEDKT